MTEQEYESLLTLANAWEAISKQYESEMRRNRGLADHCQEKGEAEKQAFFRSEAVNDEIRARVYADVSKVLALKLGELRKAQSNSPLKASA